MEFGALVVVFVVVGLGLRLMADVWDRDRISRELAGRGDRVVSISWQPFGRGWWGEKNDRIYMVEYDDRDGTRHAAWCKTSAWSGVYFSEDRVISGGRDGSWAPLDREDALRREVERLRRENEDLKRRAGEE